MPLPVLIAVAFFPVVRLVQLLVRRIKRANVLDESAREFYLARFERDPEMRYSDGHEVRTSAERSAA